MLAVDGGTHSHFSSSTKNQNADSHHESENKILYQNMDHIGESNAPYHREDKASGPLLVTKGARLPKAAQN